MHDLDLNALLSPQAWPQPAGPIELCETHISWVFLTGHYAYKIKKPVDFGFLDFSTLQKRKHFCEEEVRLNRRLAPDIYLDVVPVCGDARAPRVCGKGPVLEYAVRMRQFDPEMGFDRLLKRGELHADHMRLTAETLAGFHAGVDAAPDGSDFGMPLRVCQPVMDNFDTLNQAIEPLLDNGELKADIAALEKWSIRANHRLEAALRYRKEAGFIRECHGDLHLRNILFWQQKVVPFDCLEFEPNLRWIDVMSELAFLLMDLDDHQRPDLARLLLNHYLEITGDFDGLPLLVYYKVYRAVVRAKVASLRLAQLSDVDALRAETAALGNYLRLARGYTAPSQGRLIITHGLSASGKSWLSQQLLAQADLIRVRSDVERKRLFGLAPTQASDSGAGEGLYSPDSSARTYARLLQVAADLTHAGFEVLVDATFLRRADRQAFADYAASNHIPFAILHCTAPAKTLRARIEARGRQDAEVSEADLDILERQLQTQEPLDTDELRHCVTLDTRAEIDPQDILNRLASIAP